VLTVIQEHVLRLHMNLPGGRQQGGFGNKQQGKVVVSFLLVADELPRFVRMLRILKATSSMALFKLIFRIETSPGGTPTLATQKLVLEPFRYLNVGAQGLVITGAIDPTYERSLRASMVPEVNWVRGLAWDTYGLLVSIANVADEAFRLGHFTTARCKYGDCQAAWEIACGNSPRLTDFEDDGFHQSCHNLLVITKANAILATVRARDWVPVLDDTEGVDRADPVSSVTVLDRSLVLHCRAIAMAAERNDEGAHRHLDIALKLDPTNKVLKRHLAITSNRLAAKTKSAREAFGIISSSKSLQQLDKLVNIPPPILTPSELIAGERYLLRHFGYQGDFLDGIEEKAPVDIEEMRKLIKTMETQKANSKPGQFFSAWVGGGQKPQGQERPDAVRYLSGLFAAWQQGEGNL